MSLPTIVVMDGYTENPGDLSWEPIAALGRLQVYDRTDIHSPQEIIRRIGDSEIVLTNKTPVTEEILRACPSVRYIAVLATGYNVVDVAAAKRRGIAVSNVPAYGTAAVGQFTIALLLEICHHIARHSQSVHDGKWSSCPDWCFWETPLIELEGKVMGIIGYGRIGQRTGRIASALGMEVLAYDQYPGDLGRQTARYVPLDQLLARSDVIALHCPLTPENTGFINRDTIAKMKDGVILLNSSRGPLIVEQDLADALSSGKVFAAGLDVVSTEPIAPDSPLLSAPNCVITPHIAWAPRESRQRIMDQTLENIRSYLAGSPVNVVNL